mmetsp:Transcript_1103/g.2404  ORF Transcript_1103/g.2404 Transcript_1103/m.2404 type:complete len:196 (-) Transcript_1103:93-680(-)
MREYYDAMGELSHRLLSAMALGLSLPYDFFHVYFEPHTSYLRLNHYPPAQTTENVLGISRHTDAGGLTVLTQTSLASLQVYTGSGTGEGFDYDDPDWVTVAPQPDSFIVNTGDMMQVLSNDKYKAPLHRVLANTKERRHSAAYFYNPDYNCQITPFPSGAPSHYRPISWSQFRALRFAGDYADVGEEVQISHYRV